MAKRGRPGKSVDQEVQRRWVPELNGRECPTRGWCNKGGQAVFQLDCLHVGYRLLDSVRKGCRVLRHQTSLPRHRHRGGRAGQGLGRKVQGVQVREGANMGAGALCCWAPAWLDAAHPAVHAGTAT